MPPALQGYQTQRDVLALVPALGVTDASFSAHLSDAWGRHIDASLVSRWRSGERAMPLDAVVELARHAEARAGVLEAHVAERVLAPLARAVECIVIREQRTRGERPGSLGSRLLALSATVGETSGEYLRAMEDGDLDAEERAALVLRCEELHRQVSALVHRVRDGGRVRLEAVRR